MDDSLIKRISTIWVILSLIGVGGALYLVGRIDASESAHQTSIEVVYPEEMAVKQRTSSSEEPSLEQGLSSSNTEALVASRNGTRYYTPGCSGIGRIKDENRVYFDTPEQAEAAGLSLAQSCQ